MRVDPTAATGHAMDRLVRTQLQKWPQRLPGLAPSPKQPGVWLRGRPGDAVGTNPFLKLPGSVRMRTVPDGLWLHFGPDPKEPFVDVLCVEACSSFQNLLDKRSRFAPSVSSLLAVCPQAWLLAPPERGGPLPRWKMLRLFAAEPTGPLLLPVRDLRVVFGLARQNYEAFAASHVAHPHEFFCPMDALVAEDGHASPAMRDLIFRASAAANFMVLA